MFAVNAQLQPSSGALIQQALSLSNSMYPFLLGFLQTRLVLVLLPPGDLTRDIWIDNI